MGKIIPSGLHRIQDVFGESTHQHSKLLKGLREQQAEATSELDNLIAKLKNDEPTKQGLGCLLVLGLFLIAGAVGNGLQSAGYPEDFGKGAAVVLLCLGGLSLYPFLKKTLIDPESARVRLRKTRPTLESKIQQLDSQIRQAVDGYAAAIVDRLQSVAQKRDETGRAAKVSNGAWIFFCPSYTVMLDFSSEEMLLLNCIDCREVQISYREVEQHLVTSGVIGSATKPSIAGAAIGGLIFGEAGMVVGSIIGSASKRNVTMETVGRLKGKHIVDVYTRLQSIPMVSLDFNEDEQLAKNFYGVKSAAIHTQRSSNGK